MYLVVIDGDLLFYCMIEICFSTCYITFNSLQNTTLKLKWQISCTIKLTSKKYLFIIKRSWDKPKRHSFFFFILLFYCVTVTHFCTEQSGFISSSKLALGAGLMMVAFLLTQFLWSETKQNPSWIFSFTQNIPTFCAKINK